MILLTVNTLFNNSLMYNHEVFIALNCGEKARSMDEIAEQS